MLVLLVGASLRVTNPEDMEALFHRTQRLLAAGDFAGARAGYERLLAIPAQRLLRPARVLVQIDEQPVNLRDAARYQLANLERRQGKLLREEKELAAPEARDSLEALARAHIRRAAAGFTALRREEGFSLRERAAYLVADSYYEAEDFAEAAAACETLLVQYPQGEYVAKALYNLGWARYELQDYAGAVEGFERFLAVQPEGIRADRARLQLGIALEEGGRTEEALAEFARLGDAYNPTAMTEEEKTEVALAGLREGQSRRSIAAKAWLKRGDVLKGLGRYEEADQAYQTVIDGFGREEELVEMAWVRRGLLAGEREGNEAAMAVYRLAGERSERAGFQARMQAAMMSLLFEAERYGEALAAHRLYLAQYAGHGGESGLSEAEARFRVAECLRFLADQVEGAGAGADSARGLRAEAAAVYGEFVAEQGDSYLAPDALLAWGTVELALGDTAAARQVFGALVQAHAGTELGCHGRLQLARLEEVTADSTFELILTECGDPEVQATAALELGHRYRLQGRLVRARELLAGVPEGQRGYGHARLELAQIDVQEGEYGAALGRLDRLLAGEAPWLDEGGLRAQVQAQVGLIHQRLGDHAQALAYLEAAAPALEGELRATARFGIGWSLLQTGQAARAWQVWTATLAEEEPSGERRRNLLRGLGMCAREVGEPERALPLFEALLADPATYADGRLALRQYYLDAGDAEAALTQVEELAGEAGLESDGNGAQACLLAGKALYALDRLDEAEAMLRLGKALGVTGDVAADYEFSLGSVAMARGVYEEAIELFETARAQASRRSVQAEALYYAAQSAWSAGDTDGARQRFGDLAT
ncbi:MAG: tetratricopeptide repeat protein, partial [Gemmatimonadota bacterium]